MAAVDEESGALKRGGVPDRRAATVLLVSAVVMIVMHYVVLSGDLQRWAAEHAVRLSGRDPDVLSLEMLNRISLYEHIFWAAGCVLMYLVVPALAVRLLLKEPLAAHGLTLKGYARHARVYMLLYVPAAGAAFAASFSSEFQQMYPFYRHPGTLAVLLGWELLYAAQFFSLEFFFRGFMLHGLKHRYGSAALWIMLFPYCMIHFPKPMAESVGALLAGLVLGLLSLRTGSVLGGATIHVAVGLTMDLLAVWQRGELARLLAIGY